MKVERDIESSIEKKARNIKLESKLIAFGIRTNYLIFSKLIPEQFTIKFFKNVVKKIGKKSEKTFDRSSFKHWIKKNFDEVERVDEDEYLDKIFSEKISGIDLDKTESMIITLQDLYETREMLLAISSAIEEVENDSFDPKKVKDKLRNCLYIERPSDRNNSGDYLEDFDERLEDIKKRRDEPLKFGGVKFGIRQLDDVSGGMMNGEVSYMIAPSGHGKTIFLQNVACNNFLYGKNIGFISLEMPKKEIGYRIDSRLAKYRFSKFRKADMTDSDILNYEKRIKLYQKKLTNSFEIMCFHRGATPREIEEFVLRIQDKRKVKFDLLVVDYINLLSANNSKNKSYDTKDWKSQGESSWDLKVCAGNLELPILSAGQVTDDFDQKNPTLFQAKYARAISENANMMFALGQTKDDLLEGIIKLHILKMRGGKKVEPLRLINDFDFMILDSEMREIERNLLFGDRVKL